MRRYTKAAAAKKAAGEGGEKGSDGEGGEGGGGGEEGASKKKLGGLERAGAGEDGDGGGDDWADVMEAEAKEKSKAAKAKQEASKKDDGAAAKPAEGGGQGPTIVPFACSPPPSPPPRPPIPSLPLCPPEAPSEHDSSGVKHTAACVKLKMGRLQGFGGGGFSHYDDAAQWNGSPARKAGAYTRPLLSST